MFFGIYNRKELQVIPGRNLKCFTGMDFKNFTQRLNHGNAGNNGMAREMAFGRQIQNPVPAGRQLPVAGRAHVDLRFVDLPEHGLVRGQVGTVVERFDDGAYEVEFSDDDGRTYAELALGADALLVLHHRPVAAA